MPFDEIEQIVDLVAKSNVTEVTLRSGDMRLTIRKSPAPPKAAAKRAAGALTISAASEPTPAAPPSGPVITAPMVGIFHHAEPPVGPGATVAKGQVVGAIESMKLMNDVRAECDGTVKEMFVEAGMAVEYGQPLIALE